MARPKGIKLNQRHKLFADAYLQNGNNGTAAYCAVYSSYNKKTAQVAASNILKRPEVKAYIEAIQKELLSDLKIEKNDMLKELADIIKTNKIVKPDTAINAIKQVSKMCGFDAPIKQEVTAVTISYVPPTDDEDEEE